MPKKRFILLFIASALCAGSASAYEPPLFPLNQDQLKAYGAYQSAPGQKAFAAGSAGQFSAQTGYASALAAVREALAACDKAGSDAKNPCIIIDQNGTMLPLALQFAQLSRADAAKLEQPLPPNVDTDGDGDQKEAQPESDHPCIAPQQDLRHPEQAHADHVHAGEQVP